jgi:hypothetical protein
MERHFQEQVERIDRLMDIVRSDNEIHPVGGALTFYDIAIFACQNMWHLKDWVLNDPNFRPKDLGKLKADIHTEKSLLICADIANGSKHLTLTRSKAGFFISDREGINLNVSKRILQTYLYVVCSNETDSYHGMEIRELLSIARLAWDKIIDKHYLSIVDTWLKRRGDHVWT